MAFFRTNVLIDGIITGLTSFTVILLMVIIFHNYIFRPTSNNEDTSKDATKELESNNIESKFSEELKKAEDKYERLQNELKTEKSYIVDRNETIAKLKMEIKAFEIESRKNIIFEPHVTQTITGNEYTISEVDYNKYKNFDDLKLFLDTEIKRSLENFDEISALIDLIKKFTFSMKKS